MEIASLIAHVQGMTAIAVALLIGLGALGTIGAVVLAGDVFALAGGASAL